MPNFDFTLDESTGLTVGEWLARMIAARFLDEEGFSSEAPPAWSIPIPDEMTPDEWARLEAVKAVHRRG